MSRSPQDIYARYLLSSRGYPLWIPEPSQELLLTRRDGLRIGDVGVVVPEDGGFEVFFNICLPPDHPCHRSTGVPDNFELVRLGDTDIRIIPRAENPGRVVSTSSVTNIRTIEPSSSTASPQFGGLGYEFDLSSSGGAVLILPDGAERYDLRNHRLFHEEATRHGVDWYRFAEERLGRMINHDSLYLITGFYKTRSWSLAAFENVAGNGQFPAQFKMAQVGGSDLAGTYTWETTRSLDWRAGPEQNYGLANQSVFIRGFKVALRTGFLGKKRIEVKADAPSTGPQHNRFPYVVRRDPAISNAWKGLSGGSSSGTDIRDDEMITGPLTDRTGDNDANRKIPPYEEKYVVVQPMLEPSVMFHPSDIVNKYILENEPSATVAITHDDDWISLLEKGELNPEDFVYANTSQVEAMITKNFNIASRRGVAFLQGKDDATDDNPPAFHSVGVRQSMEDENFAPTPDEEDPPPAYDTIEGPIRDIFTGASEKSRLLSDSLVPTFKRPLGIHSQLLPYDPQTSKHFLRFDVMFPVDRICYQSGNNVRERLTNDDLDEPASDEPITKMRITFEQRPFSWTIYVDNSEGVRCRDVFEAIYDCFDQQLTLGELWRVPDRGACEEAFRIRNLVLGSPRHERSLGWKRVDVLLHHTIFHGLTANSASEGDWVLNLGAPLPVSDFLQVSSVSRDSSSIGSEEECSDEFAYLPPSSPPLHPRGPTEEASVERSALRSSQRSTQLLLTRPSRPLGPRQPPNQVG